MARRFKSSKPLYFPDLSVYRLLLQIEHNPELIAFQEETMGKLLSHESGDELIRTLEAVFDHKGNLSQAAEALYGQVIRDQLAGFPHISTVHSTNWLSALKEARAIVVPLLSVNTLSKVSLLPLTI